MTDLTAGDELKSLAEAMPDATVAPVHGVAAIAPTMAMKFHDINTVQDGTPYQQYKLEGKNLTPLHLDMVFDTAIRIERHLLASSDRIAGLLVDALEASVAEGLDEGHPDEQREEAPHA